MGALVGGCRVRVWKGVDGLVGFVNGKAEVPVCQCGS